jgi:uncharacterized membrane protein HdeD (DUF308 family)
MNTVTGSRPHALDAAIPTLARHLGRYWWVLLLRGLFTIAFGVMAFAWPKLTLTALVLLFGAFCLADGLVGGWAAIRGRKEHDRWWVLLLWALVSVAAGVLTAMNPGLTALALVIYIAVWAILTGLLQIIAAVRLRREIEGEWLLGAAGALSILVGVLMIARPGAGAVSLVWLIGSFALALGVLLVILAFRVRGFSRRTTAK